MMRFALLAPRILALSAGGISGLGPMAGCAPPGPRERIEPAPPGLEAAPRWLAFTCVEPGCDTTLETEVKAVGSRAIAVKRIVLANRERGDFVVRSRREPPFVLEATETFILEVTYRPTGAPRLTDTELRVAYGDASSEQTEDRIEPGELEIPLVRRLVGAPRLTVTPGSLSFGPVLAPDQKTLDLVLENAGFGNLGLVFERIETSAPHRVRVENTPAHALLPGERWNLSVVYTPTGESVLADMLTIIPVGPSALPTVVPLTGTSIAAPRLVTEPEAGIDFGEVHVGSQATAGLRLSNHGAASLDISSIEVRHPSVGSLQVAVPETTTSALAALASRMLDVSFEAETPGRIDGHLEIVSTDPERPRAQIQILGTATRPELVTEPRSVEFGAVPRGWTIVRPLEVRNAGFGELVVTHISLILGSSELLTLRTLPALPASLRHDERLGLEIEFRSETAASFSGTLSVDTNDPRAPFVEVPIAATGASCEAGCPIQNGEPSCAAGVCEIAACLPGWYDADRDASTGCECAEIDQDPSAFCIDSKFLGTVVDDGSTRVFRGILPEDEDKDVLRFFAYDGSEFLDDDFDVRVSLDSTDPSIRFCIHRHRTDRHLNQCFLGGEDCPPNRAFRDDGAFGTDDSADYVVEVYRAGGAAPSCTPYTLFVRNG